MRKKNQKYLLIGIFVVLSVIYFSPFYVSALDETSVNSPLSNGDFENVSGNLPVGWTPDGWISDNNVTRYYMGTDRPYSGKYYAVIESVQPNDARLIQKIQVKPNTIYRLSCRIKTENVGTDSTGANITILENGYQDHSYDVNGTSGEWIYAEFYVQTRSDQNEIIVAARLGEFGELNKGKACFDDFRFTEVSGSTAGKFIGKLSANNLHLPDKTNGNLTTIPLSVTLVCAAVFAVFALAVYYLFLRPKINIKAGDKTFFGLFALFMLVGLAGRIVIAFTIEGVPNDIESFRAWAVRASDIGFNRFYSGDYLCDYPPGYIYILAFIGHLTKLFSIEYGSPVFVLLLKLPGILSDMGAALIVFLIAREKLNVKIAFGLSFLYVFNPAVIFNSSAWGQVDSLSALFVLLIIIFILKDKLWLSALLLGFSVLLKLQTGFIFFILLFALVIKKDPLSWVLSIFAGLFAFLITIFPFIPNGKNIFWIVDFIRKTVTGYPYATINAFNLIGLTGGNWEPLDHAFLFFNYTTWGTIFTVLILVFIGILYFRMKDSAKNYLVSFIFITAIFMLIPVMHERYLYPALILSLMSYVYLRKPGLLILFVGLSVTLFINLADVMDYLLRNQFISGFDPLLVTVSIVNLCLFVFSLILVTRIAFKKDEDVVTPNGMKRKVVTGKKSG
jgi:dolichyl-phosphate-mannose-protein mannosyltransferase